MFLDARTVRRDFDRESRLGEGSDGTVEKYTHKRVIGKSIAVKRPAKREESHRRAIRDEIRIMKSLRHENIIDLLGYDEHMTPYGPALFYEFCEAGDLFGYHARLVEAYGSVPEETLWKFFADMSKALNYIHNELDIHLVHGDLKPENILVSTNNVDCVDALPRFKLADLARASPECSQVFKFNGTPEYAVPIAERQLGATRASDVFSLGATFQQLALGVMPILQWETFLKVCPEFQRMDPDEQRKQSRQNQRWRELREVVYRPLNVTTETLVLKWDWSPRHRSVRYSNALNRWYSMCMEEDPQKRITTAELVKWLVPVAERQIAVLTAKRKSERLRKVVQLTDPLGLTQKRDPFPIAPVRKQAPPPLPPRGPGRMVAAPKALTRTALQCKEERSPALKREDFGLPPRLPRERIKRSSTQNTEKSLKRRQIEQKYLKGMKKKPK